MRFQPRCLRCSPKNLGAPPPVLPPTLSVLSMQNSVFDPFSGISNIPAHLGSPETFEKCLINQSSDGNLHFSGEFPLFQSPRTRYSQGISIGLNILALSAGELGNVISIKLLTAARKA